MNSSDEIKGLACHGESVHTNPYYSYIMEIDAVLQKRFPYGAINRIDIVNEQNMPEDELIASLHALTVFGDTLDAANKKDIAALANMTQPLLFGNCGSLTNYAIGYLKKKYPKLNIECLYVNMHMALLIGRNPSSDLHNANSFGNDAIIYDGYARKCYLASHLTTMQKDEDIPFYMRVSDKSNGQYLCLIKNENHYLAGTPEIITGLASIEYDKTLIAWVAEDQRRSRLPMLTAPKIDTSIKVTINNSEIKESLFRLSKCDGWKFNAKEGVAWLDCHDVKQAERVAQSLVATKATVVSSGIRKDGKDIHFVKCTHLNSAKLKQLSDSLGIQRYPRMEQHEKSNSK